MAICVIRRGRLLRSLTPLLMGALAATAGAQRPRSGAGPCVAGAGSGGGGGLSDRVGYAYAARHDATGARLRAVMVARGPAGWTRVATAPARPALVGPGGGPRAVGGATVGPVYFLYDEATHTAFLGERPVPLGPANVLLVAVDSAGATPRVAGTARVPDRLPGMRSVCPGAGADTAATEEPFFAALEAALRRDPAVRAFVDRPGPP